MALKDLTGILKILLGVRFCGCYAFKGFVEDGGYAALFRNGSREADVVIVC